MGLVYRGRCTHWYLNPNTEDQIRRCHTLAFGNATVTVTRNIPKWRKTEYDP